MKSIARFYTYLCNRENMRSNASSIQVEVTKKGEHNRESQQKSLKP